MALQSWIETRQRSVDCTSSKRDFTSFSVVSSSSVFPVFITKSSPAHSSIPFYKECRGLYKLLLAAFPNFVCHFPSDNLIICPYYLSCLASIVSNIIVSTSAVFLISSFLRYCWSSTLFSKFHGILADISHTYEL